MTTNDDEITVRDSNNKEIDNNKELKKYINEIAPKIEDDVKKMLFNYLVTGGVGRHKAEMIAKERTHIMFMGEPSTK